MLALYQSLHKSPHGIIRLSRCLSQVLAPQTSEPAQTVLTSESSETASKRRKLPMERQEKSKLYLTEYREKNRERLRQYANAYNKEHKELRAMEFRARTFTNDAQYHRRYRTRHRERILSKEKRERDEKHDQLYHYHKAYKTKRKREVISFINSHLDEVRSRTEEVLGIKHESDWYNVNYSDLKADTYLKKITASLDMVSFLELLYPAVKFHHLMFKKVPKNSWASASDTREYLKHLAARLGVVSPKDWRNISRDMIKREGGGGLLAYFSSLYNALCFAYPETEWDSTQLSNLRKPASQRNAHHCSRTNCRSYLFKLLRTVFPEEHIYQNYRHPDLVWDKNRANTVELDLWLPSLKLAAEYQGEQHYHYLSNTFGASPYLLQHSRRDFEKIEKCRSENIRVAQVPYWWDRTLPSLRSLLEEQECGPTVE